MVNETRKITAQSHNLLGLNTINLIKRGLIHENFISILFKNW
jgi:hypothetical protein